MRKYIAMLLLILIVFSSYGCLQLDNAQSSGQSNASSALESSKTEVSGAVIDSSNEIESSDSEIDLLNLNILGKYVCSSDYVNDIVAYPNSLLDGKPAITFHEDGNCELIVNYLDGVCIMFGVYSVDNNEIFVKMDLNDTISQVEGFDEDGKIFYELIPNYISFIASDDDPYYESGTKFMDDQYVFSIINSDQIVIDKGFYVVKADDTFVKSSL